MCADYVLEDLANSEEECSPAEVEHWLSLAKNAENKVCLEDKEDDQEEQWCKLIEDIETDVAIRCRQAAIEVSGPAEAGVESNKACSDSENEGRGDNDADRLWCSVIDELVSDYCVEHENPCGADDSCKVYAGKCQLNVAIDWELSLCEDLGDQDDDVAEEEYLHLPSSNCCLLSFRSPEKVEGYEDAKGADNDDTWCC